MLRFVSYQEAPGQNRSFSPVSDVYDKYLDQIQPGQAVAGCPWRYLILKRTASRQIRHPSSGSHLAGHGATGKFPHFAPLYADYVIQKELTSAEHIR
jgi:hypothetical protein